MVGCKRNKIAASQNELGHDCAEGIVDEIGANERRRSGSARSARRSSFCRRRAAGDKPQTLAKEPGKRATVLVPLASAAPAGVRGRRAGKGRKGERVPPPATALTAPAASGGQAKPKIIHAIGQIYDANGSVVGWVERSETHHRRVTVGLTLFETPCANLLNLLLRGTLRFPAAAPAIWPATSPSFGRRRRRCCSARRRAMSRRILAAASGRRCALVPEVDIVFAVVALHAQVFASMRRRTSAGQSQPFLQRGRSSGS